MDLSFSSWNGNLRMSLYYGHFRSVISVPDQQDTCVCVCPYCVTQTSLIPRWTADGIRIYLVAGYIEPGEIFDIVGMSCPYATPYKVYNISQIGERHGPTGPMLLR